MPYVYRVTIIESERGWGQRVDEVKDFLTPEDAEKFVTEFNKKNDLPYVPDWYMVASGPDMIKVE